MSAAPNYSFKLVAEAVAGTVSPGFAMVKNADGSEYDTSTTAARGSNRSSGLALGPAPIAGFTIMQCFGDIDPVITGLTTNPSGTPVRVSATGQLERCTPVAGDDVVGWADPNGTLHCAFGLLPWNYYAGGVAGGTGVPDNSVQYRVDASTFGGAAKVGINSDGSLALYPASIADALPASGTLRTAEGFTWTAKYVSAPAAVLRYVQYLRQDGVYFLGGITTFAQAHRQVTVRSQFASELAVIAYDNSTAQKASVRAFGPDAASPTAGTQAEYGGWLAPNAYLCGTAPATPAKPFGGGDGLGVIEYQRSAPATGALASTMMFRVTGPGVYEVLFPGDDVTTGWRNLLEEAGTVTITTSPAASQDMAGMGHIDCRNTGAISIKGFKAPTNTRAKRFTILNNSVDGANVTLKYEDAGATAPEDRIWLNSATDLVIAQGDTYLLTYSASKARWVVAKGV